jgi:hypothetical protein
VDLVVEGALTAMLALGSGSRAEAFASCSGSTVKVVAGARNTLHLLTSTRQHGVTLASGPQSTQVAL